MPKAPLPTEVARQSQREMDRLRRMPSGAPEAAQVRAYLQWIWSMPWESQVSEDADLVEVERTLAREHLGLEKAKERVGEYLAVRRLKPDLPGPAVPGGPARHRQVVARRHRGARAEPAVRAHHRERHQAPPPNSWARRAPCPARSPARSHARCARPGAQPRAHDRRHRPVVGAGRTRRGRDAALELLDRETSRNFTDHYLGLSIDLSHAILVLCANHLEMIPDILGDRIAIRN